jgi:hypothetical protein
VIAGSLGVYLAKKYKRAAMPPLVGIAVLFFLARPAGLELEAPDAYVDLYDFACQLSSLLPISETKVLSSTQALTEAIGLAGGPVIVAETHRDGHPWMAPSVTWTFSGAHGVSIYFPLGEGTWLRDCYRGTEPALAADTHWDEFIHDAWYAGQMPPSLPAMTPTVLRGEGMPDPIDPAARPGLLSLRSFAIFLPIVVGGP